MSKLFWLQGYRQLKLITTLNQETKSTGHLNACGTAAPIISPGQEHEITVFSEILGYGRVVHTPMEGIRVVPCNQQKDCNLGENIVKMLPEDGVAVGDRGFCSRIEQFIRNGALFIIRIKSN